MKTLALLVVWTVVWEKLVEPAWYKLKDKLKKKIVTVVKDN